MAFAKSPFSTAKFTNSMSSMKQRVLIIKKCHSEKRGRRTDKRPNYRIAQRKLINV